MIHHANNIRENDDGVKVGGHQASSASMVSLITALYFGALRPEDRVAVKPHASPIFHAMQYLVGNVDLERMQQFRGFGGVQSYPSRTKDIDDVDFSTGSVGLGVAITSFASMMQDYVRAKPWGRDVLPGRMIALMGDAELDEGNIYECLQEGWKHDLRNCWWIIDYNRQSLDGIVHEGLWERAEKTFQAFGWDFVRIKYGALQRAAFAEPGGDGLKTWIDQCPNQDYSALAFLGGAAWRSRLEDDLGDQGNVSALLARRSDAELATLMENLGGNCVETVAEQFVAIDHERPVCFLAYTIKGWGTPLAGHKDNHGGLMTTRQMDEWRARMKVRPGCEWDRFEGIDDKEGFRAFLSKTPFFAAGPRRFDDAEVSIPQLEVPEGKMLSTQSAFGKILDAISRMDGELSERIITASPDVSGTTNLGPWINRKKLFARAAVSDAFREAKIPSTAKWEFDRSGQHIELGIAEMNLFLALGAAGLSDTLFGKRLLPVGTVYDPFICRGLDALNYACYQNARFMIVGTPSGISLAPEGGAHQSIGTPLIGMTQDGLTSFEPAFADELAIVMKWGFEHMQAKDGGATYLRLTTRPLEQPHRHITTDLQRDMLAGAYWWRPPGPNCQLVIAYQGAIADQAIRAAGQIAEYRRDVAVLAITSADRLHSGLTEAQRRRRDGDTALSHIELMLDRVPQHTKLLTVIDGHPATLSWLGGVCGHSTLAQGVDHFGQTGTVNDLYQHYRLDTASLVETALAMTPGRQPFADFQRVAS
ncbi:MAG: transketolase [Pseudomonadota bacterium]|nr:transketolase [Pseudomonadota bacterium]